MKVKVQMKPVNVIINRLGVGPSGPVQLFVTETINRRITDYMPFRTGMLATKLKYIKSPTEIEVAAPQARMLYYGKKMVNAKTGKGPAMIPGIGYRYRAGTVLKATDTPLKYDLSKNPKAGPFWDRRLMAAEGKQIAEEIQDYVNRR